MFAIYEDAIFRFFSQIKWLGKPIPVVLAAGDRAYTQAQEYFKNNGAKNIPQASGVQPRPYPFCSFWLYLPTPTPELNNMSDIRDLGKRDNILYSYKMRKPKAMQTQVDVVFLVENKVQYYYIWHQVETLFHMKQASIPVDFSLANWYQGENEHFSFCKIMGQQNLRFDNENFSDQSQIEDSGLSQSVKRLQLTGNLHIWLPYEVVAVPTVQNVGIQIRDMTSNTILEESYTNEE